MTVPYPRAAKVCFAVACKVVACNIKRWAKATAGASSTLQRFLGLILDFLDATEVAMNQMRLSYAAK